MNCHECQDWLQRRLDGELHLPPDGEEHLARCPACRGEHHAAQLLLDALQEWQRPAPPAGLAKRIVSGALADRRVRRLRLATMVALAASLLLAALAGYLWLPKRDAASRQDVAKKEITPAPLPRDAAVEIPSLARSVEEAGAAVAALTEKIADRSKEQAQLWWPFDVSRSLTPVELKQQLEPAAQSLRQTGQGASVSLQTVAQSARRAVSYFFRELPPLETIKSGS
jgi:hypothetical protein